MEGGEALSVKRHIFLGRRKWKGEVYKHPASGYHLLIIITIAKSTTYMKEMYKCKEFDDMTKDIYGLELLGEKFK